LIFGQLSAKSARGNLQAFYTAAFNDIKQYFLKFLCGFQYGAIHHCTFRSPNIIAKNRNNFFEVE
jgi:hypothetical protein